MQWPCARVTALSHLYCAKRRVVEHADASIFLIARASQTCPTSSEQVPPSANGIGVGRCPWNKRSTLRRLRIAVFLCFVNWERRKYVCVLEQVLSDKYKDKERNVLLLNEKTTYLCRCSGFKAVAALLHGDHGFLARVAIHVACKPRRTWTRIATLVESITSRVRSSRISVSTPPINTAPEFRTLRANAITNLSSPTNLVQYATLTVLRMAARDPRPPSPSMQVHPRTGHWAVRCYTLCIVP